MNTDNNLLIGLHLPVSFIPTAWLWLSIAAFFFALVISIYFSPWKKLAQNEQQHVFFGAIVVLLLVWSLKAGLSPGLGFHHLGATLFTLMFGWPLAIIGLGVVMLANIAINPAEWTSLGINGLINIVIPVMFSYGLLKLSHRILPDNFFIYIFVCAFFGAGVSIAISRITAMLVLIAVQAYSPETIYLESFRYLLLFMFPEAFVTGMLISVFVVYRPQWVATFDDERYIIGK